MEAIVVLIIVAAVLNSVFKAQKLKQDRPGQGQKSPLSKPEQSRASSSPTSRTADRRPAAPQAGAGRTVTHKPAEPAARQPKAAPRPAASPANPTGQSPLPTLQDLVQTILGENAPVPKPAKQPALSRTDEKGCVGGSLPHDVNAVHEGESSLKMPPRLEFIHPDSAADFEPRHHDRLVSAQELRRAVVMAEVLGKPKALRPRGQRM